MLDYKMWANTLIAIMLTLAPTVCPAFSQALYRALYGKQPQLKLSVVHEIIRRIKQTQKQIEAQSMALVTPPQKKNFNRI